MHMCNRNSLTPISRSCKYRQKRKKVMRTRRWVCTIRYDRRNAERLMCLGSWPGLIGQSLILDTGVHSSICGHSSHGVERASNETLKCCSPISSLLLPLLSFADRKPDTLFLGNHHPCSRFANREEAGRRPRSNSHGRHSDLDSSTPGFL